MLKAVADTHALIWYLENDARLSQRAGDFIDLATLTGDQVGVSSVSMVEMVYLSEKGRITAGALTDLIAILQQPNATFVELPLDRAVALALPAVPRDQVPDMPDRIIAATAARLQLPLISRDGKIQLSVVPTIW